MKKYTKVLAFTMALLSIIAIISIPGSAFATSKPSTPKYPCYPASPAAPSIPDCSGSYLGFFELKSGYLWWASKNSYYVYKESSSYKICGDVSDTVYHGGKWKSYYNPSVLKYSKTVRYTGVNAYKYSVSLGGSASSKLIDNAVKFLGSKQSNTFSVNPSSCNNVYVSSSASAGYYKLSVVYNFYKLAIYEAGSSCKYTAYVPTGKAYVCTLYSGNGNNWGKY